MKGVIVVICLMTSTVAGYGQKGKVYPVAQKMPAVATCAGIDQRAERKACTNDAVVSHLVANLKYPSEALSDSVKGTVLLEFVVTTDGAIKDISIGEDPGSGLGDAALKAFKKSKLEWQPGEINGEAVNVLYRLPVSLEPPNGDEPAPAPPDYFMIVDSMPRLPQCLDSAEIDLKVCNNIALNDFFMDSLQYPKQAIADTVEGMVATEFIIDEMGKVSNIVILDSLGSGCDEEAVRLLKALPQWTPGKQQGEIVKVKYQVPVAFQLKKKKETE